MMRKKAMRLVQTRISKSDFLALKETAEEEQLSIAAYLRRMIHKLSPKPEGRLDA